MGGLMHVLEVDDLHRASTSHPGCAVVPAALALGRQTGVRGRAFLDAVLHGYEAVARVGMAVGPAHYRIWHNTATCGPYGSAMAAAALLGLDEAQTVHALGNAGTQSAGLWQFLATGAMSKHLHAGRAAEAGVVAAELAAKGFTGPPAILEGPQGFFAGACPDPDPGAVLRDPSGPWQVHATSIKPWPSCRHTHPTIDAALEVSRKIKAAEIDRVEVATYAAAVDVCDRPRPTTPYEAKFSLQHSAAIALLDGAVGFASFESEARQRAARIASAVTVRADDRFNRAYPGSWGAEVVVTLNGGKRFATHRAHCKGDPEAALGRDQMIAKARDLLTYGAAPDRERLIGAVLALADDGPLPEMRLWD
jgi:2-methylcitrate dehydratase PrpD